MGLCSDRSRGGSGLEEVPELFAVGNTLSSQNVEEDGDDDVVLPVLGVLDDGVSDQEEGSEVLGAVAGQKESDSGVFDGISQNWLGSVVLAGLVNLLDLLGEHGEFALEFLVFGVLSLK